MEYRSLGYCHQSSNLDEVALGYGLIGQWLGGVNDIGQWFFVMRALAVIQPIDTKLNLYILSVIAFVPGIKQTVQLVWWQNSMNRTTIKKLRHRLIYLDNEQRNFVTHGVVQEESLLLPALQADTYTHHGIG